MRSSSWVRGAYQCTLTVDIFFAIMGLITLSTGCALISGNPLPYGTTFPGYDGYSYISSGITKDELIRTTLYFALGVGLLVLGILFFVWFAILTGCTICLRTAYKDDPNASQLQWTPVVRGWRICTLTSCILLPLLGLASLIMGTILVTANPLLFVGGDFISGLYPNTYYSRAMYTTLNYAGGAGLITLAFIFFLWCAILTGCTVCLRIASKDKLDTPQSEDESYAEYDVERTA